VRLNATDDELFTLTMAVASGEVRDVPAIDAQLAGWGVPLAEGERL